MENKEQETPSQSNSAENKNMLSKGKENKDEENVRARAAKMLIKLNRKNLLMKLRKQKILLTPEMSISITQMR